MIHELMSHVKNIYECKTEKDLLDVLIDNGIVHTTEILANLIEEMHYDSYGEIDRLIELIEKKL